MHGVDSTAALPAHDVRLNLLSRGCEPLSISSYPHTDIAFTRNAMSLGPTIKRREHERLVPCAGAPRGRGRAARAATSNAPCNLLSTDCEAVGASSSNARESRAQIVEWSWQRGPAFS